MAKKHITFEKNENKEQHLKPYCEYSRKAAEEKSKADEYRPLAADELKAMLDAKPETKGYTGTVVYICDGAAYKIRVQRPDKTDWLSKQLKDPNLKQYKSLKQQIKDLEAYAKDLEEQLALDHPRCTTKDFVIAYLK